MEKNKSKSLELARNFLGKKVKIVIDRPIGSLHPKHNFIYEVNYGYLPDTKAPDGEELDAYYLGIDEAVKGGAGIVVAIIHRLEDDDDKLVVAHKDVAMSDEDIERAVFFQEKWFKHEIIR